MSKDINDLKREAEKWQLVTVCGSVLQTCSFSIWVIILLVLLQAPWWGWIIAAFYVFSHWFHFITWALAGQTATDYRKALDAEKAA